MSNSLILIFGLLILLGLYLNNNIDSILSEKCPDPPKCPECPITNIHAMNLLKQLAKGCTQRLVAVLRESIVSKNDISYFLNNGDKRVIVVTNIVPENLANIIVSNDENDLAKIKAIVLGVAIVGGLKTFMVVSINNGKMTPLGAPTTNFEDAFRYMEEKADITINNQNLVLYIDEDINCDQKPIEKCCGKRREGLAILNDNENLSSDYGNSMFNYYLYQRNF